MSFQLVKYGFQKVYGTDTNPNAIIGLTHFIQEIELDHAHLFGKWVKPSELLIFNPPWLPTSQDRGHLDQTI
ncbi:hypothetical protein MWU59_10035 [Flavobacteriaceae bacterium F08102]|nr:hypothetical protein [Flavobacteriaceae bacterium F08102]